jgi:2-polyprenyl-3-methyl-5-hydroxy-6-metoxy-1,4-benzoquinol methylase
MARPEAPWAGWLAECARRVTRLAGAELRLRLAATRCPICGSQNLTPAVLAQGSLLQCRRCLLLFRESRPSTRELRQHYQQVNLASEVHLAPSEVDLYLMHRATTYDAVGLGAHERATGQARIALDVGCGNGLNMDVLANRGWTVEGIDPNPEQVARLVRQGKQAQVADLEQACQDKWRSSRYQLVTMLHLVEHLNDPLASVRAAAALLGAGGLLAIETPLSCDVFIEDHLFFFTGTSLHLMLERAGLRWRGCFVYIAHAKAHDNILVLAQRTS